MENHLEISVLNTTTETNTTIEKDPTQEDIHNLITEYEKLKSDGLTDNARYTPFKIESLQKIRKTSNYY